MAAQTETIYIGTYTPRDGASRGIYAVPFDPATGGFGPPAVAAETANPTFLARRGDGRVLFALGEIAGADGRSRGAVRAFRRDPATGALTEINAQPIGDANGTHLALSRNGRALVAVSYSGGYICSFPVAPEGKIGPRASWIEAHGTLGPRADRQDRPHPHSVTISPDNRHAYVCDLGLDRVFCFTLDPGEASLRALADFPTAAGAGPRHSKFSSDGRHFYVIDELANTIAFSACDPASGTLLPSQTLSTLPAGFAGESTAAEIRLHPNGRFVYGSNRGHDSLAVFARDPERGTLTLVEIVPCGGRHPRNFALSPDGNWLVCANRDTDNLTSFRVDPVTGRLTPSGQPPAAVPRAVCVLFADGL
jgi:6-phosphogluconolactonase